MGEFKDNEMAWDEEIGPILPADSVCESCAEIANGGNK